VMDDCEGQAVRGTAGFVPFSFGRVSGRGARRPAGQGSLRALPGRIEFVRRGGPQGEDSLDAGPPWFPLS
jgi:hypothetical protein